MKNQLNIFGIFYFLLVSWKILLLLYVLSYIKIVKNKKKIKLRLSKL